MPMPVIAALRDGAFLLISKVDDDKVVAAAAFPRLETMMRAECVLRRCGTGALW